MTNQKETKTLAKCIKVLLPTGEVRLKYNPIFTSYYVADDPRSKEVMGEFCTAITKSKKPTIYNITHRVHPSYIGEWVEVVIGSKQLLLPVITQYGDKFPDQD